MTHINAPLSETGRLRLARTFFADHGITVLRVLADNGSCYRSFAFRHALGSEVSHKFTRPYRPQTNGKVERFNRTLAAEWAYANTYRSETARAATYQAWIHEHNHHGHPTAASEDSTPSTASATTTSVGTTAS